MDDNSTLMANAIKTSEVLRNKVGRSDKQRHIEINAVVFLEEMRRHGGTFVWEGPALGMRFSTIFQAMAAAMPEYGKLDYIGRHDHIEEYSIKLKSGFYAARKWFVERHNNVIFFVPEDKESSQPTVLTLFPDYLLRSGKTAAQMQAMRDSRLVQGQVVASARRVAGSYGTSAAMTFLDGIVNHAYEDLNALKQLVDLGLIPNENDDSDN